MVSCVPGSPIDWAAMMPTASPLTAGSRKQVQTVTLGADPMPGMAG
jgi:hypothetical protein